MVAQVFRGRLDVLGDRMSVKVNDKLERTLPRVRVLCSCWIAALVCANGDSCGQTVAIPCLDSKNIGPKVRGVFGDCLNFSQKAGSLTGASCYFHDIRHVHAKQAHPFPGLFPKTRSHQPAAFPFTVALAEAKALNTNTRKSPEISFILCSFCVFSITCVIGQHDILRQERKKFAGWRAGYNSAVWMCYIYA